MKKLFMTVLLGMMISFSSGAMAEWVRVSGNDKVTVYADPTTMRKKLNIVKIWTLFDYKDESMLTDGSAYLSAMRETEFNCKDGFQRMTAYSIHSSKMGKGKLLESGNEAQEWKPVSRVALALEMKKFACKSE